MKNILFLIIIFSFFTSCENDEKSSNSSKFVGRYKVISLKSDVALDLNIDSNPTDDFLIELNDYFQDYNNFDLRIRNDLNETYIDLIMPKSKFFPEHNDYNVVYEQSFSTYGVNMSNLSDLILSADEEYLLDHDFALIENAEILPYNTLKLNIKHKFYHHPDGWHQVNLIGVFEKY